MNLWQALRRKNQGSLRGRPARRPGRARRQLMAECLEDRALLSNMVVNGTPGDDHILLYATGTGTFESANVRVGDIVASTALIKDLDSITINGGGGNDTIDIEDTFSKPPMDVPVTVNGGDGNDTINVSPTAQDLTHIKGSLTINGDAGSDKVTINDQANGADTTYSLTAATVAVNRPNPPATISYLGIEDLTLNGGQGVNTYNVQQAGIPARINAGPGTDTIKFSNGASVTGVVDGQGGFDTLDFSPYATPVTIDLAAHTATGTGGYEDIQRIVF